MDSTKPPEVVKVNRAKRREAMAEGRELGGLVLTLRLGDWIDLGNGLVHIQVTKSEFRSGKGEIRLRFLSDTHIKVSRSQGPHR